MSEFELMWTLLTHLCVIALGEELQDQRGSQRMNVEHYFTLILLSGLNLSFSKHIFSAFMGGQLPAEKDSPLTDLCISNKRCCFG